MKSDMLLKVNGQQRAVHTDPQRPLLDVLREDLSLTGAKFGCGEGRCGACTVLVDGVATRSCVTSVGEVKGKSILTIEGLASGQKLHPVQQAFLDERAFQCGYCTPGMVLTTVALLERVPRPSDEQIASVLERHLCRCCEYPKILKAVRRAAKRPAPTPSR